MRAKIQEILRSVGLRALMVIDIGLLMVSFGLAGALILSTDPRSTFGDFFTAKVSLLSCVLFAFALLIGHGVFVVCNLYQSKRMSTKLAESWDVLRAMVLVTLCLWCEVKVFRVSEVPPYYLLAFFTVGTILITATRSVLRLVLAGIRKRGRNLHHILILGTNERAVAFANSIEMTPERGFRVLGFVDDDWQGMEKFKESNYNLACNFQGFPDFLRRNVVDEIAIYLPVRSFYATSLEIAQLARQHGMLVRFDTDIFGLKFARHRTEATNGIPHIVASSHDMEGWQLLTKRVVDFIGSLILLIVFSPLFLLVVALIKLTSPGKVLFAQKRVGLNKREFTMYKFRTMVPSAESVQEKFAHLNEMSGPVFKIKNDPRVTPIGRLLRKTSIDELPQLFNVLKGDMSLVGPRAMSVRDYQFFNQDWQRRRFSVQPGITCLWQVYGRNTIPFEQWMELDMQYIDKWSLWLDLKILALTIPAVFRGVGAG